MRQCKLMLMLALLLVSMGMFAQTTVEFVAGVDNGTQTKFKTIVAVSDQVSKDGVTMSSNNGTFNAGNTYAVKNIWGDKELTFSAAKKITKIEFVGGENLGKLSATDFDAATAIWTGSATEVKFTVKGEAKYAKAIVTLQDKYATTLAFNNPVTVSYIELNSSTSFSTTLKSGDNTIEGKTIKYESSNPAVATVDADGTLTPLKVGETVVKAVFDEDDTYEAAEAQLTFHVVDGKNIFHETFDNLSGEGGNDGNFDYMGSPFGSISVKNLDNEGWSASGVGNGDADKCARVEMSCSITTPAIATLNGDAFLFFRAAQNRDVATTITLSVSGGGTIEENSVKLNKKFKDYVVLVKDATPNTKIKFSCSGGACFFLDDVKIERAIVLDENADNSAVLQQNDGLSVNVVLKRTLTADSWNTLCLPFSFEKEFIDNLCGISTQLKRMQEWKADENTIYFTDADEIEAGQPYLIKPTLPCTTFMFEDAPVFNREGQVLSGNIAFCGIMSKTQLQASDVFLGTDGKLYNPDTTAEDGDMLKGFRAYFQGIQNATDVKVNIDSIVTGINSINGVTQTNADVYSIDGQYMGHSTKNLKKGIYIVGDKKMVVK